MKSPAYHPESNGQAERMINLSGRIVSAHRRQIKIPKDSRRRRSQRFVFSGESPSISAQLCNSNNSSFEEGTYGGSKSHSKKRKRSEEDDTDSDFYGFAADSLLFEEDQDPLWNPCLLEMERGLDTPRACSGRECEL
ncbi:uncharacterized protein LOC134217155 [Armigeres subalbatus]|uniref:uncharacterized protein LOC134217155 n=1 Tax=Armigeres subalbatus TaxID=124917 RepID=UPI002ED33354